jgi:hypothetical protein
MRARTSPLLALARLWRALRRRTAAFNTIGQNFRLMAALAAGRTSWQAASTQRQFCMVNALFVILDRAKAKNLRHER